MTLEIVKNSARWVILLAVQILVFNNIYLGGVYNPFIYILIILSLPIETNKYLTLLIAFATGFILDMFTHTYGMHTMALTLTGFLRPFALRLVAPRDGYDIGASATLAQMGFSRYAIYTSVLVLTHHLMLFAVEGFFGNAVWNVIQNTFVNSVLTMAIIFLFQAFTRKTD